MGDKRNNADLLTFWQWKSEKLLATLRELCHRSQCVYTSSQWRNWTPVVQHRA